MLVFLRKPPILVILGSFLILNTAIFLNVDYKTKFNPLIICTILLFSINMPKYENFNLFSNINLMAKYSFLDSETNKDKYNSYYIIPDKFEYWLSSYQISIGDEEYDRFI